MTVYIVTDLGYGDSGKGTTVDSLSRQGSAVVVRHNGGPQAGHNVVTDGGRHHTFSQFGSGSFAGAKTFLSKYMLINPLNMELEAVHLIALGETDIWHRTFVDEDAKIITPFHVVANQLRETARGADRHGSCGQGVGMAVEQDLDRPELTIRVKDLDDPEVAHRMDALRIHLSAEGDDPALQDRNLPYTLAHQYRQWVDKVNVVPTSELGLAASSHDNVIFEGAQGVLLDQWHGFHPYTTWSTTTGDNAIDLLWEVDHRCDPVVHLGVTRAYMTRHGAGPFVTEDPQLRFAEPHNSTGPWQGAFRQGHMDLMALRYAVEVNGGVDQLVVTHLDRAEEWRYADRYQDNAANQIPVSEHRNLTYQGQLTKQLERAKPVYGTASTSELLTLMEEFAQAPIGMTSHGPTASEKSHLEITAA